MWSTSDVGIDKLMKNLPSLALSKWHSNSIFEGLAPPVEFKREKRNLQQIILYV